MIGFEKSDRAVYAPYLLSFKSERLAVIALTELLKELINTSVRYHKDQNGNKRLAHNQISLLILTREVASQMNK